MNYLTLHVFILVLTLVFSFSCSENEIRKAPASARQAQARDQNTQPAATGRQVEIIGTVERDARGFAIWTLTDTLKVEGRDLSEMVGRKVRVTGHLGEDGGQSVINVKEVQVLD